MSKRKPHTIEAYGNRGFQNKPWRKTFAGVDALNTWVEANDATCLGTRERDPQEIAAEVR